MASTSTMMCALGKPEWLQDYINSIIEARQLEENELTKIHPFCATIHRKAATSATTDEETKRNLGRARKNPAEYIRIAVKDYPCKWNVNMNKKKMGLSCTKNCAFHNYISFAHVYPFDLLNANISGLVTKDGCKVDIAGCPCRTYKCYSRSISTLSSRTVKDALDCCGKHDSFLINEGSKFSCYWDTNEHCTLCLKDITLIDTSKPPSDLSYAIFDNLTNEIVFGESIFDRSAWTECNYLGVKVTDVIISSAQKGEMLDDATGKMDDKQAAVINALDQAFYAAPHDAGEENRTINALISTVFQLTSLSDLTAEQSYLIIQIIDKYEHEIYGWDTTEWFGKLRPLLVSIISDESGKIQSAVFLFFCL